MRVRNAARHIGTVHDGHHDVVIAICDEYRDPDAAEVLGCLAGHALIAFNCRRKALGVGMLAPG
ncbi:hypothetical protein AU476_09895 [Cupriavidus sp. UYMSc13B]|nr:hypothetical protein AU476_09895 [Cupriavidus sp. UYMSc13B]